MEDPAYRIDDSRIISEMLDGETIIIDFKNGSYYSLNSTGSALWEGVRKGYARSQIMRHLAERFAAEPDAIERAAHALLAQLVAFSIIAEDSGQAGTDVEPYEGPKQAYFAPALQQFEDMQEMLLADPIHDVDETGWPALKS